MPAGSAGGMVPYTVGGHLLDAAGAGQRVEGRRVREHHVARRLRQRRERGQPPRHLARLPGARRLATSSADSRTCSRGFAWRSSDWPSSRCLLACLGIANTMYTAVAGKDEGDGVIKALGARSRDVLLLSSPRPL